MNKRIIFIIILGILSILIALGGKYIYHDLAHRSQEPVSMIIASDTHYLSPDYRGEYFKEPQAIFDGKLIHYSNEYFDAFLSEVMEQQPKVLILSGDITLNGSKKSHQEVLEKLTTVQNSGIDVLVIPGNHDVHTTAGDYSPEEPVVVENYTSEDFMTAYENFGPAQALSRDTNTFSYIYEVTPYLRLLMIDTNCMTKGTVPDDTLTWIENELKAAQKINADVIAVTHQNLHIHNEILYFSYQLYNADELLTLYEKYNVDLNLSGHIHIQSIVDNGTIPEVAVASLGICGTPYGELTYDGKTIQYTTQFTDVDSYAKDMNFTDSNLLHFNEYSIYYFEEVGRLQITDKFTGSNLSDEDITLLADTFAHINSSYFMGTPIDIANLENGIALWRKQESSFIQRYIETMLNSSNKENQTLTIQLD